MNRGIRQGFDADLVGQFAKKMNLKITFVDVPQFKLLIPKLLDKSADIIGAGMTVTTQRKAPHQLLIALFHGHAGFCLQDDGSTD